MTLRIGLVVSVLLAAVLDHAAAQAPQNWPAGTAAAQPQPNQPVVPHDPTLQAREPYGPQPYRGPSAAPSQEPAYSQGQPSAGQPYPSTMPSGQPVARPAAVPPQPPAPPFTLSPQEQNELNTALVDWEQKSKGVKTFSCKFQKWEYNVTMAQMLNKVADPNETTDRQSGEIEFAAPDKGFYKVDGKLPEKNKPRLGNPPEKWLCDGRSIYSYDFERSVVTEYPLPTELQGKAIADGPLPFIFGASAEKLKQRYYLRLIHAENTAPGQTWLQALPRYQQDAANFSRARLILNDADKLPVALELTMPNGRDRTVYMFEKPVVNNVFAMLQANIFYPTVPLGWTKKVESAQQQRVTSQPPGQRR